jgi:hypothetical protein
LTESSGDQIYFTTAFKRTLEFLEQNKFLEKNYLKIKNGINNTLFFNAFLLKKALHDSQVIALKL